MSCIFLIYGISDQEHIQYVGTRGGLKDSKRWGGGGGGSQRHVGGTV
jgi:hypothetical protein